jgi:hypothetical protein
MNSVQHQVVAAIAVQNGFPLVRVRLHGGAVAVNYLELSNCS